MDDTKKSLGETLFNSRDYTPIPLIILAFIFAKPTVVTVTLGMLAIFLGEMIRIYSVAFIGPVSRTRSTSLGQKLITDGPFGLVRNPLYVGNFFIAIGFAVYSGLGWLIILTLIMFAFQYYHIVEHEEGLLVDRFGEEYEAYRGRVPAWIPRSLPALDDVAWPTSYATALRSERPTLTSIAAILLVLMILAH